MLLVCMLPLERNCSHTWLYEQWPPYIRVPSHSYWSKHTQYPWQSKYTSADWLSDVIIHKLNWRNAPDSQQYLTLNSSEFSPIGAHVYAVDCKKFSHTSICTWITFIFSSDWCPFPILSARMASVRRVQFKLANWPVRSKYGHRKNRLFNKSPFGLNFQVKN